MPWLLAAANPRFVALAMIRVRGMLAADGRDRVVGGGVVDDPAIPPQRSGRRREGRQAAKRVVARVPADDHHRDVGRRSAHAGPRRARSSACARRIAASVSSAERCHVKPRTRAVPRARRRAASCRSPMTRVRAAAKARSSSAPTMSAASPATSGIDAAIRGDDRRAVSHRLEQGNSEALDPRREHEGGRAGIERSQRRRCRPDEQRHVAGGRGGGEFREHVSVAREEDERQLAPQLGRQTRRGAQHDAGVLQAVGQHVRRGDAHVARRRRDVVRGQRHRRRSAVVDHREIVGRPSAGLDQSVARVAGHRDDAAGAAGGAGAVNVQVDRHRAGAPRRPVPVRTQGLSQRQQVDRVVNRHDRGHAARADAKIGREECGVHLIAGHPPGHGQVVDHRGHAVAPRQRPHAHAARRLDLERRLLVGVEHELHIGRRQHRRDQPGDVGVHAADEPVRQIAHVDAETQPRASGEAA